MQTHNPASKVSTPYHRTAASMLLNPAVFPLRQVREVLLNSKLPMDTLGRIWDLSDMDKDGFLDRDEFTIVSTTAQCRHRRGRLCWLSMSFDKACHIMGITTSYYSYVF